MTANNQFAKSVLELTTNFRVDYEEYGVNEVNINFKDINQTISGLNITDWVAKNVENKVLGEVKLSYGNDNWALFTLKQ